MLKIEEIADHLGLSKPQTRRRIKAIKDLLDKAGMENSISRGDYNQILVKQDAFGILKQLEEYRKMGNTTKKAKEKIEKDLDISPNSKTGEPPKTEPDKHPKPNQLNNHQSTVEAIKLENEQLKKRIEEIKENKNQQIQELREDKQYLKNQINELQQKLLPAAENGEEEKETPERVTLWEAVKSWWNSEF